MAKTKREKIEISIISPEAGETFKLGTSPVETGDILLKALVKRGGRDVSGSVKVNWKLRLSWQAKYNTYQTLLGISGNPAEVKFQTGGALRIRASVIIDGREYSARTQAKIIGINPTKAQLKSMLNTDVLKAIAWQESTWRQFDLNGQPLLPKIAKGKKQSWMRGLFQISEWWWGRDKRIKHNDHNRVAWQWEYNIETAKEILNLLRKLVAAKYPVENENRQWNRTFKAYTIGEASIKTKDIPDEFWYVKDVREALRGRPWEKE